MSRKSKNKLNQAQPIAAKLYVFSVADASGKRVAVAAPVFYQLIRRGWASHAKTENGRDKISGRPTENRIALLVNYFSFRSLKPSPEGNLCFKSLLESHGVSIKSQWELVIEKAWALDPRSHCPHTLEEVEALKNERQAAIWEECKKWGVPEPQPVRTGFYGSPEDAALAIAERQLAHAA